MMKPHISSLIVTLKAMLQVMTETSVVDKPVPAETAKTIVDILEKEAYPKVAVQSDGRRLSLRR